MKQCVVYYESWVKDDGYPPFSVGDTIHWVLTEIYELNDPVSLGKIDYLFYFDYVKYQTYVIEGKISKIQILYHRYIKNTDTGYHIPVDGILVDTEHVKGLEKNINDMRVDAYIVTITDYTLRDGLKEEYNGVSSN